MHSHTWTLVNAALGKYRCACGVYGHKPTVVSLRNPKDRDVKPYLCQAEGDGRRHCGKPATHVTGTRTASRCEEHAP